MGQVELILKMPKQHVVMAAKRLLRPWKEEKDGDRSSIASVGSVLVNSAAGVPRGKRYRFRITGVREFRPDPLNQPGGPG